jgi:thiamine-monophosphate kinase
MRSEFEFINDIKSRYNLAKVGDDCAVLPKDDKTDLLITSDMLVEGIDFRLEWATPEQIGYKALAVSLSDIAAMGGTPTCAMLSIAVVENLWKGDFLDRIYAGWHKLASKYGVELIGGDISRSLGPLTIDSTVLGEVATGRAILRSGARPGDAIYITGTLGGAAGGLRSLLGKSSLSGPDAKKLISKLILPSPEITAGKLLQRHGLATAAIDVSDGLSSDMMHICEASGVGAEIDGDALPIEPALRLFFSDDECLDMALHGGEDFELLFTAGPNGISLPAITRIGTVTSNAGELNLIFGNSRKKLEAGGYRHF